MIRILVEEFIFNSIGGALIGSAVLKSLANEADREEEIDLSADLYSHSQLVDYCIKSKLMKN